MAVKVATSVVVPVVPLEVPGAVPPQLAPAVQLSIAPAPDQVALAAWAVIPDNSAKASAADEARFMRNEAREAEKDERRDLRIGVIVRRRFMIQSALRRPEDRLSILVIIIDILAICQPKPTD